MLLQWLNRRFDKFDYLSSPILGPRSTDFLGAFLALFEGAFTVCNVVDEVRKGGRPLFRAGGDLDPVSSLEVLDGLVDFDFVVSFSGTIEEEGVSLKLLWRTSFGMSPPVGVVVDFGLDSLLTDIFDFSDGVGVFTPGSPLFIRFESLRLE
jgi:hypothetical protein